ncbi:MAG: aspartate-semialdehyde dehydrogenase [Parachlamydiaceae bacterium]
MSDKIPVSILGATGSVGQRFIELLRDHPWFKIVSVAASDRSAGRRYGEAVNWLMSTPLPKDIGEMVIERCEPGIAGRFVFSALDTSVAGDVETAFAKAGYCVISNASNHRMQSDVPLLIPEVNGSHLGLLNEQKFPKGKIVTNPNCSAIGLCLALKPLYDAFGIDAVHVVTMQAISGAGYPGIASMDIMDNVIPYIRGEEHKLETEPLKILGSLKGNRIEPATFAISAQCNRVPVIDGHTECVSIKLGMKVSPNDLISAWRAFSGEPQRLQLPSAPLSPIHYLEGEAFPQPKLHRQMDKGMAVMIGRLRPCSLFDYKFTLLSHNTIRGAAGGALLCAELIWGLSRDQRVPSACKTPFLFPVKVAKCLIP